MEAVRAGRLPRLLRARRVRAQASPVAGPPSRHPVTATCGASPRTASSATTATATARPTTTPSSPQEPPSAGTRPGVRSDARSRDHEFRRSRQIRHPAQGRLSRLRGRPRHRSSTPWASRSGPSCGAASCSGTPPGPSESLERHPHDRRPRHRIRAHGLRPRPLTDVPRLHTGSTPGRFRAPRSCPRTPSRMRARSSCSGSRIPSGLMGRLTPAGRGSDEDGGDLRAHTSFGDGPSYEVLLGRARPPPGPPG